ncbi:TonB-dependent receptor [Pseudidiomarina gelatinasegens]|uniref:TonB-dependent receptor n=1 Tax=Pseudidiomarina gelatinasegens TaxID=2487740 RepID=A0A443YZR4_9GAMM|nr:TonB-dependent receptor [Pseudidiomarina gelatinasegens]RWU09668.1 TonB-dependent receptor [Pseudidiomarina gelatinasegens]
MFVSSHLLLLSTLASASVAVDEVIVVNQSKPRTAQETPASISNADVSEQPAGLRIDAAELLKGLAGVQADSRANYAQDTRITLRGFGARSAFGVRGIVLQLDGIPLSMPDGQAQTSSILLDEPENVQVIRGPLATIYGNSAGGMVQWFSRRPDTTQLRVDAMAGSNATQRQLLQGDWVDDSTAIRVVGTRLRTDGPRDHNSAERDQLALRWYQDLSDSVEMIVRLDDNNAPHLQDPGSLSPDDWRADPTQTFGGATRFNTRKAIHHQQMSVSLRSQDGWHINSWKGWRDIEQYLPFPGGDIRGSGAVIDLRRSFVGVDASYDYNWEFSQPLTTTVGVHHAEQDDRRFGYENNFGERGELRRNELGEVTQQAIYSLTDWRPVDDLTVLAGLRYSDVDFGVDDYFVVPNNPDDSGAQRQHAWSWSLGLNYQVNDHWQVFIARGNGFETATLTELAYSNTETGLNTELGAAYNQQLEAGVKWQGDSLQAQLTAFRIDTTDEIVVDQSIDGRTTYTNAGLTERSGIELEASWFISDNWNWRTAATLLEANYASGERLPGVAERQLYSQLNWDYRPEQRLSVITEYRGDVAANDANTVIAPSHTLWHLNWRATYSIAQWQVSPWVNLHNVTDKAYVGSVVVNQGSGRAFEPGTGRELQAGVQFNRRW